MAMANSLNGRTLPLTWIKRSFIIICSLYCLASYRQLTIYVTQTTDYILIRINTFMDTNETKNIVIQNSHRSSRIKLNSVELKEISEAYEEVPVISPMNDTIHKYMIDEIYFTLTTNTTRIRTSIHYLKFWAKYPGIKCLIVFEQNDFINNSHIIDYLVNEGIKCRVITSNITSFIERYFELFHIAWNNQENNNTSSETKTIQWFAVGDDDTVWFINNLLYTLQQYNSSKFIYLGDVSAKKRQIIRHGDYFAYGGGGILLSRPLTSSFSRHIQECKQFLNMCCGDAMIGKCVSEVLKVNLTRNNHFHQMDQLGDNTGYMEGGIETLVSLHHIFTVWVPFPFELTNQLNEMMYRLQVAYTTFNENFLKRYIRVNYKTNQTYLLTMGYTFSLFNRILSHADLIEIENTWDDDGDGMAAKKTRPKEKDKITWFFKGLTMTKTSKGLNKYEAVYENKKNMYDQMLHIEVIFVN